MIEITDPSYIAARQHMRETGELVRLTDTSEEARLRSLAAQTVIIDLQERTNGLREQGIGVSPSRVLGEVADSIQRCGHTALLGDEEMVARICSIMSLSLLFDEAVRKQVAGDKLKELQAKLK